MINSGQEVTWSEEQLSTLQVDAAYEMSMKSMVKSIYHHENNIHVLHFSISILKCEPEELYFSAK